MAMRISAAECVFCGACEMECPNEAIAQGEDAFAVDPARCTECVGHFDEAQCVVVCPVECIEVHPQHQESQETLLARYHRLQAESTS